MIGPPTRFHHAPFRAHDGVPDLTLSAFIRGDLRNPWSIPTASFQLKQAAIRTARPLHRLRGSSQYGACANGVSVFWATLYSMIKTARTRQIVLVGIS